MELTHKQKIHLYEQGYVKIAGVIPDVMVRQARRAINHSLGEGVAKEEINVFRSQSYCPELCNSSVITDLYHKTPAKDLIGSVIDTEQLRSVNGGQIALRFPTMGNNGGQSAPHIDGMYSPNNGVPEGTISNFTALLGVFLSDIPEEDSGNFTVWPGTHLQNAAYFKEHGAEALLKGMPNIDMPKPVQLTGRAGDIVLVHYLLAHAGGVNISADIRYAIFFRITSIGIKRNWQESMVDLWMHWPGMHNVVQLYK